MQSSVWMSIPGLVTFFRWHHRLSHCARCERVKVKSHGSCDCGSKTFFSFDSFGKAIWMKEGSVATWTDAVIRSLQSSRVWNPSQVKHSTDKQLSSARVPMMSSQGGSKGNCMGQEDSGWYLGTIGWSSLSSSLIKSVLLRGKWAKL